MREGPSSTVVDMILAQTPTETPTLLPSIVEGTVDVASAGVLIALGAAIAFAVHILLVRLVFRWRFRDTALSDRLTTELRQRCRWPARATSTLIGAQLGRRLADLEPATDTFLTQVITIGIIVAAAWWAIEAAEATEVAIRAGSDFDEADNRRARQNVTRAVILRRAVTVLVVIVGAAAILLTFDGARTIGASLLASAGVISIVLGVAAQSTLGNLIAGVQIAFTEILKLDDVVVIEGEWGNVEAIGLTSVVVRTWDRRRLVLPTSWFTTQPFQNWTRGDASQIVGAVVWHLDHRTDVEAVRTSFHGHVEASPHWDGEVATLQVVGTTPTTIEVRGLASANGGEAAWNLRCDVREAVLTDLVADQPAALPRTRVVAGE